MTWHDTRSAKLLPPCYQMKHGAKILGLGLALDHGIIGTFRTFINDAIEPIFDPDISQLTPLVVGIFTIPRSVDCIANQVTRRFEDD